MIQTTHSKVQLFPLKALKIALENAYPENGHLSTTSNCIAEPQGNTLTLLLNSTYPLKTPCNLQYFPLPLIILDIE